MTERDGGLCARLPALAARARIVSAVRRFFDERGFLEVETPVRVVCPGLEPHLAAVPAGPDRWLRTSPELHLKRLVAAGAEKVYEIARCFRGDESGPWHMTEFTLLEWYRADAGLEALVDDVHGLLLRCAEAAGAAPKNVRGCDLTAPPERVTVRDAFRERAGIDLAEHRGRDELASRLSRERIAVSPDDGWEDLFFKLFIERIEPHLGRERVTILSEYPASQAALARVREDAAWPVALRFEAYVAGVELANAFDELTDPAEQRRRHEADRSARAAAGREVPPLDEAFLAALEAGCPASAGIALGLDRLVALLLGLPGVRGAVAFPG